MEAPRSTDPSAASSASTNGNGTAPNSEGRDAFATSASSPPLLPQHQALLAASGIMPEIAGARGYRSAEFADELAGEGFTEYQRRPPGLLLPVHDVSGRIAFCQFRPDDPRTKDGGKAIKYETPKGARMVLDVPPGIRENLRDITIPLFITEGIRKADSAVSYGYTCIDLLGVDAWRGKSESGGKAVLADWESIAVNDREV